MVPHQPSASRHVLLAWSGLSVSVPIPPPTTLGFAKPQVQQWKPILTDVSGFCESGQLTAIMGASGAGKSTLLATVSQRACLNMEGQILLNSRQPSRQIMTRISGFVPQHDVIFPFLTVIEHITFMANLMMDRCLSKFERKCRIENLLNELGLLRSCHTRLARLSGGEMKRLSLAVQLLGDPVLLFCDEPTTGLDSHSAGMVIEELRRCAERGTAILATIHQPASQHFHAFHRLLLLAGGRVAYSGCLRSAQPYFARLGLVCPPSYNLAEFYVKQLASLDDTEGLSRISQLSHAFSGSQEGEKEEKIVLKQVSQFCQHLFESADSEADVLCDLLSHEQSDFDDLFHPSKERRTANWFIRFYSVLWRGCKEVQREPTHLLIQYTSLLVLGSVMSAAYMGVGNSTDQRTVQDLEGLLALSVFFMYNSSSQKNFRAISKDMPILRREIANGLYGPLPHYLSKVFIATGCSVMEMTIFCALVFWAIGLRGGVSGYFIFTLPVLLLAFAATGFGLMMSACIESVDILLVINAPLNIFFFFFSGFFGSLSSLPAFLGYFKYTSMFYFALEAMSISQWQQVPQLECWSNADLPCLQNGTQVMDKYGYSSENYTVDLIGLVILCAVTNTIGFIAFYLNCRQPAAY